MYIQRGDVGRAAFTALTLRRELIAKSEGSLATGWLKRAQELLEAEPESVAPRVPRDRARSTRVAPR